MNREKERNRLIIWSAGSNISGRVVTSFIGLAILPFSLHYLGKEKYGFWMMMTSLVYWLQLADIGIGRGLVNVLSEAKGKDDHQSASEYITTALTALCTTLLICLLPLILLSFALPWSHLLNIKDLELAQMAGKCFFVVGLLFLINIPVSVADKALTGFQFGYISGMVTFLNMLLGNAGIVLAILLRLNILWLLLLNSLGMVLGSALGWVGLRKKLSWYHFKLADLSWPAFHRLTRSSIPLFVFQITLIINQQLANIILAFVMGLEFVADYNIVLKVFLFIFAISSNAALGFYPAIREAFERHEMNWVRQAIKRTTLIRAVISFILTLPFIVAGDFLIQIWIRNKMENPFGLPGWTLVLATLVLGSIANAFVDILLVLDDIWPQVRRILVYCVLNTMALYYLAPAFQLRGAFMSMLLPFPLLIYWTGKSLFSKLISRSAAIES